MLRRVFVVPPRPDLEPEVVRRHWEQRHAVLFRGTPGLRHYRQNRPVTAQWADGTARFCSETWYADRESERRAYVSGFYRTTVTPDEASFLQRSAAWSAVVLTGAHDAGREGLRLLWFDASPPRGPVWHELRLDRPVPAPGVGRSLHVAEVEDAEHALALLGGTRSVALLCRAVSCDPARATAQPGNVVT